ncbi:hypothetical protein [Nocardiopsis oceani]
MRVQTFLRVLAVYYALPLGAVWLITPQTGLGENPDAYAEFVARVLGGYLVTIGAMNWIISYQSTSLIRQALWVNILMNMVPATISTTNIANGVFDAQSWIGVAAHTIPIVFLVFYLWATGRTARNSQLGHDSPHPARGT